MFRSLATFFVGLNPRIRIARLGRCGDGTSRRLRAMLNPHSGSQGKEDSIACNPWKCIFMSCVVMLLLLTVGEPELRCST
ncbi:uncharacterized protein BP01DRAFT_76606 [Aspergillus saccharolyticus JOP 1030-1]|uniref:Uncharacterized protein n=1 Tax=Aspergillus saccharolyticus JOP 1030-1 TaxID=1450539 RepID=A0A318ZP95_9EURO|nr:hypothetical protein BP01DRAFT_76606 [Aspergillus saccharolyticus JOP 1030-1]PYH49409.1 hypothetical protein BP01DRAFT_76606 [Aspergillus saccharolyticus JOP 1030-1]